MTQPTAMINGQTVPLHGDDTILTAARRAGIFIPTLCAGERTSPHGGCRLCLVEGNRFKRPVGACHTVIQPGMEIQTNTPRLEALRRDILALYLESEAKPAFVGDGRETQFTRLLARYGLSDRRVTDNRTVDDSHPQLRYDPLLCITCRRCVRACEEIQGQFVYHTGGRGPSSHLVFGPGDEFAASACVACGACVDECPTGAISDRDRLAVGSAEEPTLTESVCGYCGVGCRIEVAAAAGRVLRIRGVPAAVVNRGHLCLKGRYAHSYHHSPDRLTQPLKRVGDEFQPISWEAAIAFAAQSLLRVRDAHGADALGVFTSSRSTNEAAYLLQKLFRTIIGTNNIDCCARVCHSSTALALQLVTGTGAATASYADLEQAKCFVLAGANPTEAHPVVGARIKQAVLRGASLVVIDPRRIELAEYANLHLALRPGTNVALFNGLAKLLVEDGWLDHGYLLDRVEGFAEFSAFLDGLELPDLAEVTGITVGQMEQAARLIGHAGPVLFVHGLGLSELTQGTASVMTLCNLGMLTGSIGRRGAGMLPLRGQNNVQGNADMGSMPNQVTGYQALDDPAVRARLQEIWGAVPPVEPGRTTSELITAAADGAIRALWIQGEDIVQSDPHETHVRRALESLDFLIVQELFLTDTARYAHLVLPAAACLEQEGTFTNGERRIQHVRPAVPPPGQARADWSVIQDIAAAMGARWRYAHPAAVLDEVARVAPKLFGGVSYDRLETDGLQWPCPSRDHPGTDLVHAAGFLRGKGKLTCVDYAPNPEHGVAGYPYLLMTGRVLEHYNVGTMTRRSSLRELVEADFLEMHAADAAREGIGDGDEVTLESRWGRTTARAEVSRRIAPGTLFLSFHYPETHANRLTGPHVDPLSKCPQYKVTAVRVCR